MSIVKPTQFIPDVIWKYNENGKLLCPYCGWDGKVEEAPEGPWLIRFHARYCKNRPTDKGELACSTCPLKFDRESGLEFHRKEYHSLPAARVSLSATSNTRSSLSPTTSSVISKTKQRRRTTGEDGETKKMRKEEEKKREETKGWQPVQHDLRIVSILHDVYNKLSLSDGYRNVFSKDEQQVIHREYHSFYDQKQENWRKENADENRDKRIRKELSHRLADRMNAAIKGRRSEYDCKMRKLVKQLKIEDEIEEDEEVVAQISPDARTIVYYTKGVKEEEREKTSLMRDKGDVTSGRPLKTSFIKVVSEQWPEFFIGKSIMEKAPTRWTELIEQKKTNLIEVYPPVEPKEMEALVHSLLRPEDLSDDKIAYPFYRAQFYEEDESGNALQKIDRCVEGELRRETSK